MTRRILVVLAFLACSTVAHAQTNCSTGQYPNYNYGDYQNSQSPCTTVQPGWVTLFDNRTANERCTGLQGQPNVPPGSVYSVPAGWGAAPPSVDTGYGQRACPGFVGVGAMDCWPRMSFYETDGGKPYPNGTMSDTSANRFFNQGYDHAIDIVDVPVHCVEVAPPGNYSSQDFKQCPTLLCQGTLQNCPPVGNPPICCGRYEQCYQTPVWNYLTCSWQCANTQSPIIIDLSGKGYQLTNALNGVSFDISGTGHLLQMGWTAPGAQNAFLCLPDSNGQCDDGKDLFGNFTPQPVSSTPNGFDALAVYDKNGDGVIDARDAIFPSLRLWIDANHDGISQPNELFTLAALGITSISLDYKWDQRTDQYGNMFRYRAEITSTDGAGRFAYDVFLVTQPTTPAAAKACPPRPLLPTVEKSLR